MGSGRLRIVSSWSVLTLRRENTVAKKRVKKTTEA